MIPGTNLFIKIFLGFWLVSAIILGSWLVTARYFESLPDDRPRIGADGPPRQFLLQMFYELQNTPDEQLPKLLRRTRQKHGIDIFLLTPEGADLYQRKLPPGVAGLAAQLDRRHRRKSIDTPNGYMFAHLIHRDSSGPLRAVVVFKPHKNGVVTLLNRNLGLRLALAIIVSGLVCFGLSRLLTRRIRRLQRAARQLASGDLSARIEVRKVGGDETDELARDLNSMAAQLEQRIEAQKRLLSDVSHELRSPLARLHLALALAQQNPEESAKHLERIDLEAERLETLIKQLLSTQGEAPLLDSYIDLVSLLHAVCDDAAFEGEPEGKRVEFSTNLDQAVIPSYGDSLKRCFENILRNAVKYTPADTVVKVTLSQTAGAYVTRIEDHGPGASPEELDKLFDEFYRSDSARLRETGGYGLGLSIAKRAVLQHQGSIRAENTGRGLAVEVRLPCTPPEQS